MFFCRILTPEKVQTKNTNTKKKWTALGCLSMRETPNTSKKNGKMCCYKLIDLAHISISFSQPRWWLKIIDWKMSTLRLIDFCTCSLSLFSSSCSTSFGFSLSHFVCAFVPWHWWDETQIRCQNKQEIYQSPERLLYLPAITWWHDKCEIKIRQVHYQTIDERRWVREWGLRVAAIWMREEKSRIWQMRCRLKQTWIETEQRQRSFDWN